MASDVKSARRVLEIFEYFAERRAPASVMEIAKALGYPQSSTSVLLRSLVELGYLDQDRRLRLYAPNIRLALIGNWIQAQSFGEAQVAQQMERLRSTIGETVILGLQNGTQVQYAYILETQEQAIRWHLRIGTLRPMTHAALGQVLLSVKPEADSRLIVRRLNAELEPRLRVDEAEFMQKLQRIRRQGYAVSDGALSPGAIVLAMMLPPGAGSAPVATPIAIGIGGPAERLKPRQQEILAQMRAVLGAGSAPDADTDALRTAAPQRRARKAAA
jgi:DNA-binding IclR family transcriptional regulator